MSAVFVAGAAPTQRFLKDFNKAVVVTPGLVLLEWPLARRPPEDP
jgi:hypothetical protein